jgi:virulence-associated protein VapD
MKMEMITVSNKSVTRITLMFDPANLIEEGSLIVLRIPVQFGNLQRSVYLSAQKINYPTAATFLERVEQVGKAQIADWLEASTDQVLMLPFPDAVNAWCIGIENKRGNESVY